MRHYETLYIVNPELDEEDYKAVVGKFKDLVEKEKGVIVKLDEWGKQRLAYLVKKVDQGAYVLMDYCGGAGITAVLERDLKLDDRILKYQTVKLADEVEPQALEQKEEVAKEETAAAEDQAQEKEEVAEKETAAAEDQAQEKEEVAEKETAPAEDQAQETQEEAKKEAAATEDQAQEKEEVAEKETAAAEDQAQEKEEEAKKEAAPAEDQAQEKQETAQDEKIESDTSDKEVKNGI